jgi:uncharacterized protein (TIGR02453 family)
MASRSALPGFPAAATRFFAELEEDNSKAYWESHRQQFDEAVRAPMEALLDALPDPYQPFHVFRMNRDLRFSPDKSPYKTQHGAVHPESGSVHYVHLDATGLLAACGAYVLSSAQLDRYRRAVDEDGTGGELEGVLMRVAEAGLEVGVGGADPLKTAPRGYPKDHPRIELLRQKGVIASARLPGTKLRDGDPVRQFLVDTFATAEPLHHWLGEYVGDDRIDTSAR